MGRLKIDPIGPRFPRGEGDGRPPNRQSKIFNLQSSRQYRKETLDEVIDKVYNHPDWGRDEIVKFLNESRAFLDRVHDKAFREEYGKIED